MPWKELKEPSAEAMQAHRHQVKPRFLVDESMGITVARILRNSGYNAKFVEEIGLRGRSDEDIMAAAWKEKRVLLTHDADFLDDQRFPPHRNPGVVVIRPGSNGRESQELLGCLSKTVRLAAAQTNWFHGRKFDFTSADELTITSQRTRQRYLWKKHGMPMIWED